MVKDNQGILWIVGIVIIVILLYINSPLYSEKEFNLNDTDMSVIGLEETFSIYQPDNLFSLSRHRRRVEIITYGENCSFITNTDYFKNLEEEEIKDYSGSKNWISIDWNKDGVLEGYAYSGKRRSSSKDYCSGKEIIGYTPNGFKIVKYLEKAGRKPYKEIAICGEEVRGRRTYKYAVRFSDKKRNAKKAKSFCPKKASNNCWLALGDGDQNNLNIMIVLKESLIGTSMTQKQYLDSFQNFPEKFKTLWDTVIPLNEQKINIYMSKVDYGKKGIICSKCVSYAHPEGYECNCREMGLEIENCGIDFKEKDIIWNYYNSFNGYGGIRTGEPNVIYSNIFFEKLYIHEIGHTFGLDHPKGLFECGKKFQNIMGYGICTKRSKRLPQRFIQEDVDFIRGGFKDLNKDNECLYCIRD